MFANYNYVVYKNKKKYASFPSLVRVGKKMYAVFRVVKGDNSETHVNTRSYALVMESDNQGKNWSRLHKIKGSSKFSGIQDIVFAPARDDLGTPPDLFWFEYLSREDNHTSNPDQTLLKGVYMADITGQNRQKVGGLYGPNVAISHPPLYINGKYLVGVYGNFGDGVIRSAILRQSNNDFFLLPAGDIAGDFTEPCLVYLGGNHLLCLMRVETPDGIFILQSHSWDGGQTWLKPVNTKIRGLPANVIRLQDERLLCTYGYRRKPYGIRACFSYDNGITWDTENFVILRGDGGGWDIGYPKTVEIAKNEFMTIYYFYTKNNPTRRIEVTIWRS